MTAPLSDFMLSAVKAARTRNLRLCEGGFWSYDGCRGWIVDGVFKPEFAVSWATIKALLDRGLVTPSKTTKPDGRGYVVEVQLVPSRRAK